MPLDPGSHPSQVFLSLQDRLFELLLPGWGHVLSLGLQLIKLDLKQNAGGLLASHH
jgi:hypothetical protein